MSLPRTCPLCNADQTAQSVVTKHVYGDETGQSAFFHCLACDVRYQYPLYTQEEANQFYRQEFAEFMSERVGQSASDWKTPERHVEVNRSTLERRMEYLEPHLNGVNRLLEVGCSSGFMLYPLINTGISCVGIEPSGVFSNFVSSRGIPVYSTLEDLTANDNKVEMFDLVQHFFVLEHVLEPKEFLKAQLALLRKGGKIIFEVPNVADPLVTVYNVPDFERFYWSKAHPWYFSESSLSYLLEMLGKPFKVFGQQRYDLSNHFVWALEGRPGGMARFSESLGQAIDKLYREELVKSGYCDTLVGIVFND